MVTTALLINLATDSIALLILIYIVYTLASVDNKYVKENLLKGFELMKRDKVFRKSLVILALSLFCAIIGAVWTIYSPDDRGIITGLLIAGGVFKMGFFIYLIGVVRATML